MPDLPSLDVLIARMADGERAAFAEFYDRTSDLVFGLLVRILGDRVRAAEVAQRVYAEYWQTAGSYEARRGSALSWIALIARSRAVDAMRSERSYGQALQGLSERPADQPLGAAIADPEEEVSLRERRAAVQAALEALPAEQREVVDQAFFGGLSHREIARATNTPLGTVKSRMRAAFKKLEETLSPIMMD